MDFKHLLNNEDFVGKNTTNPLHDAFPQKQMGHPGGAIKPLDPEKFQAIWTRAMAEPGEDRDRAAYLHIPFCRLRCTYCGFFKNFKNMERQDRYVQHLLQEIRSAKDQTYVQGKPVKAIYFGGGTPGVLKPEQIRELMGALKESIPIDPTCEITFETSICDLDDDQFVACLESGVNRFSFGIQTFDTDIRRSLGRPDDKETLIRRLNELATKQNQATIVIDLIYGLPGQTMEKWMEDIEISIESQIHGLDTYSLKVFPGSILEEDIQNQKVPPIADRALQADMYVASIHRLEKAGLRRLSTCHWGRFDLKEHSCYNRLSKSGGATIPFGAGAGGNIDGVRIMQESDVDRYEEKIRSGQKPIAFLTEKTPFHFLVGQLRGDLDRGFLSLDELENKYHVPVKRYLSPLFDLWEQRGLVNQSTGRIELTLAGQVWNVEMTQAAIGFLQMQLHQK